MTEAKEQQVASEMVEIVALAIATHPDGGNITPGSSLLTRNNVGQWDDLARAVIAAMREPTVEMTRACLWPATDWNSTLEEVWRCMIDAALSGSGVGHQTSSPAPVLSSAAISDAANAERLLEPFLGPEGVS